MNKRNNLFSIIASAFLVGVMLSFPRPLFANYGGYGGGSPPQCSLAVDKLVADPAITKTIEYIDNISATGTKFKPDQAILMKMKVKNTSNRIVSQVVITDHMPAYLSYVAGPAIFNKGGSTFTIQVGDLNPQEEKSYIITFKAASEKDLPNQMITCVTNKIIVQADNCGGNEDTAQVCIERSSIAMTKGGVPITQTPTTGPEFSYLFVTIQAIVGGIGYIFVKKSKV